jgi:hypothetical protein
MRQVNSLSDRFSWKETVSAGIFVEGLQKTAKVDAWTFWMSYDVVKMWLVSSVRGFFWQGVCKEEISLIPLYLFQTKSSEERVLLYSNLFSGQ